MGKNYSETILSRDYDETLTLAEVKRLCVEHGLGVGGVYASAEDFGVLLSEPYNEGGEVFTWGPFMEWLGY